MGLHSLFAIEYLAIKWTCYICMHTYISNLQFEILHKHYISFSVSQFWQREYDMRGLWTSFHSTCAYTGHFTAKKSISIAFQSWKKLDISVTEECLVLFNSYANCGMSTAQKNMERERQTEICEYTECNSGHCHHQRLLCKCCKFHHVTLLVIYMSRVIINGHSQFPIFCLTTT